MKRTIKGFALSLVLSTFTFGSYTKAVTITEGFTFTVASSSNPSIGTHFHSSTGGDFGNPAGKAEVGSYGSVEQVRGLSEYNIAGLTASGPAFVTFNVFNKNGLFGQPQKGNLSIDIYSYPGNNTENISDFQAPATGFIGSFNTSGLSIGDTLSFDINSLFDIAIGNGDSSFGVRLQPESFTTGMPTWTFDNFRLTTDNQSTKQPVPSPLPFYGAAVAFGYSRKLRMKIKTNSKTKVISTVS
jgi:hypothetical protein